MFSLVNPISLRRPLQVPFVLVTAVAIAIAVMSSSWAQARPGSCARSMTSPQREMWRQALGRGIELFNSHRDFTAIKDFQHSYAHGASVESVQRSLTVSGYLGSSVRDFQRLHALFDMYQDMNVVHAFPVPIVKTNSRDRSALESYAEFAAERFDSANGGPERHGVVVIFSPQVRRSHPVEHDPEDEDAVAIIFARGIAPRWIEAVIPQSAADSLGLQAILGKL